MFLRKKWWDGSVVGQAWDKANISTKPPPPHNWSWEISSLLQEWKQWSTEDQREGEGRDFFIFPKYHFCNFFWCYHGYHMTFELISTETAIVDTDKHRVYPQAFIKNRKYRPTAKNVYYGIVLPFNIYFWLFTTNWGHRIEDTMKRKGENTAMWGNLIFLYYGCGHLSV